MNYQKIIILLLLATGFFSCQGPTKPAPKVQFNGTAQGTYYAITYYDIRARNFQNEIDSILQAFDQSVSVYQPNSIVSRINRNETDVVLDEWFIGNFRLSQEIAAATDGSFDMTIGPIANIWGFGTFEKPDSINPALIDSVKQYVDYRMVRIEGDRVVKDNPHIELNFNAVAQGYAVDVLVQYLVGEGIDHLLIDLGGEIYAKGQKPNGDFWKIGIEVPEDHSENRFYNKIVALNDEAVATSGNYRKFYEIDGIKYAHSLDPKSGYPVQHSLLSTTVIAESSAMADAYATAFMVMGVEKTLEFVKSHHDIKVYLMYDEEGQVKTAMSENFKSYLEGTTD
ncbi:MAG: FAD:protein FMN transferase [Bacteroidales bacterium]|nr:FAD:protein FMN transferase [Bacteroidales bacterium]